MKCGLIFASAAIAQGLLGLQTPEDGCYEQFGCVSSDPAWVAKYSIGAGGPEQIWINYGPTNDTMVVGWLTADAGPSSVQYGTKSGVYTKTVNGTASEYTYGDYTSGLIHHVTLRGLALNTKYYFHVGVPGADDGESFFVSNSGSSSSDPYPYTMAFIGDVGESAHAENTVTNLLAATGVNAAIVLGDIAYANGCEATGCTKWDAFQRMMQPFTQSIPTSILIGNHDMKDVADGIQAISSQYRFASMPVPRGSPDGVFYFSYNAGPLHVVTLSSFYPGGFGADSLQTQWLEADLSRVDRAEYPWVVVVLHAPWYNSNTHHTHDGDAMREAYEATMLRYGVNAIFSGHVHAYERSLPVDNFVIVPAGLGMVHVTIGDGGAGLYNSWLEQPAWSAFRDATTWGHAELVIANATHALIEWHRHDEGPEVISDSYWILNTHTA